MNKIFAAVALATALTGCTVATNLMSACVGAPDTCAKVVVNTASTAKTIHDAAKPEEDTPDDSGSTE